MTINKNLYLVIILAIIGSIIFINRELHKEVNKKFSNLENRTFDLSFATETLINSCKTSKANTSLINTNIDSLRKALENQVKAEYAAGKLISAQTFCKLLDYNMLTNRLIDAGENVCASKELITNEQNDAIKHELLPRINKDNLAHHSFFTDDALQKYTRSMCQKS